MVALDVKIEMERKILLNYADCERMQLCKFLKDYEVKRDGADRDWEAAYESD